MAKTKQATTKKSKTTTKKTTPAKKATPKKTAKPPPKTVKKSPTKTKPATVKKRTQPTTHKRKAAIDKNIEKTITTYIDDQLSKHLADTVDDEGVINSDIDFCGIRLNSRQHAFLVYYLTPGQPCFNIARQSAIKAGYSINTANVEAHKILRKPNIQKIVEANKKITFQALHEAARMAIEIKKHRAFFDPADFFEKKEITIDGKHGEYTKEILALKNMENMTEMQRMCIDGLDIKGQSSIPVYLMPDRAKELNDIVKLDTELSKSIADTSEEETREIIMERITIRETKRAQRPTELEYEIIDEPIETDDDTEEDDV